MEAFSSPEYSVAVNEPSDFECVKNYECEEVDARVYISWVCHATPDANHLKSTEEDDDVQDSVDLSP